MDGALDKIYRWNIDIRTIGLAYSFSNSYLGIA